MANESDRLCRRCGYVAGSKGNLKIHLHKKKACPARLADIPVSELLQQAIDNTRQSCRETGYTCRFCNKVLTSRQGRYHHERDHCKLAKGNTAKDEIAEVKDRLKTVEIALQVHEDTAKNYQKELSNYQQELTSYQQEISDKDKKVKDLELALQIAKQNIKEETYQKLLEQHRFPGATHLKVACGVTDITTDTVHAEIKRFEDWKEAIGQLMAYNVASPRSELHVYLFGNYSTSCKRTMVSTLKELNMKPFEMFVTETTFSILDLLTHEEQHYDLSIPA